MESHDSTLTLDRMQHLLDVPVTLRAELDQRWMTYGELMELNAGSIVRLPRPTGENVDIYTGEVLIGWGEILLIDGSMAVRIADLKSGPATEEAEARGARGL